MLLRARDKETLFFQNAAGGIFYNAAGYVRFAWTADRVPVAVIQDFYEQGLALLRSQGTRKILSEHGQRAPLPAAAQDWLTQNWIPRAISLANTRHTAIVEGADPIHRLSTQSVVSGAPAEMEFKRFSSVTDADTWLRGL